jgi:hypothetical protein
MRTRARFAAPAQSVDSAGARVALAGIALVAICGFCRPAIADKISHPTAVFEGLDKITGRIISFDVAIDETVQFGSLQITPRICYSRPLTEAPRTDAFAEVDEIDDQKKLKTIFSGWMFADNPGLHGVEHPVYDVWLTDCKGEGKLIHEAPEVTEALPPPADADLGVKDISAGAADIKPAVLAPAKKRRPKPPPAQGAPLDLGAQTSAAPANAPSPLAPRKPITRRFFPAEADAPVPPADVGQ